MSYRGALWEWRRGGKPGAYSYVLAQSDWARRLRYRLREWVQTKLDGFVLATDPLTPAEQSYEREFTQAGDAAPMMDHVVEVEAVNGSHHSSRASVRWTDPV